MKNNLKVYRKSKKLSQEDLGKILNVSRQTVISIENGKYNPSLELAFKISTFFDCKIEDIFIWEDTN